MHDIICLYERHTRVLLEDKYEIWVSGAVINSTGISVAIANNALHVFLLRQQSLDIKIMLHEDI